MLEYIWRPVKTNEKDLKNNLSPRVGHLAVFQQIKHLKDNSSRQNPLVIVGFLV